MDKEFFLDAVEEYKNRLEKIRDKDIAEAADEYIAMTGDAASNGLPEWANGNECYFRSIVMLDYMGGSSDMELGLMTGAVMDAIYADPRWPAIERRYRERFNPEPMGAGDFFGKLRFMTEAYWRNPENVLHAERRAASRRKMLSPDYLDQAFKNMERVMAAQKEIEDGIAVH